LLVGRILHHSVFSILLILLFTSALSIESNQQNRLIDAIRRGNIEEVRQLLDASAKANPRKGDSPLTVATRHDRLEIARLLIDAGAEVNDKRRLRQGRGAPLHRAVIEEHISMARLLLSKGADVNLRGGSWSTPLHYSIGAASKPEEAALTRLLLENGADVNIVDDTEASFLNPGCRATVLQKAVFAMNPEIVALLIDNGASLAATDGNGLTAIVRGVRGVLYRPSVRDIHEQARCQARRPGDLRGPNIHSVSSLATHHDSDFRLGPIHSHGLTSPCPSIGVRFFPVVSWLSSWFSSSNGRSRTVEQ
jgi:ankyrin repeat protein